MSPADAGFGTALRLHRAGCWAQAVVVYDALLADPRLPPVQAAQAHANRGAALRRLGRVDEAVASCIEALVRCPDMAEAYANIGAILQEADHPLAALDACRRAIALSPGLYTPYLAIAHARQDCGDHDEALTLLHRAATLAPAAPSVRYNLAEALLQHGLFEQGWQAYETRWQVRELALARPACANPEWTGQDLTGKTLLVVEEQGFGDTLQFIRLIPLVKARGAHRIILQCRAPLVRLLAGTEGVDAVTATLPDARSYDLWVPLLSLMQRLAVAPDRIPATVPYLTPPPDAVRQWARALPETKDLRIGLVWAGDPRLGHAAASRTDARRSLALAQLAPLLTVPEVSWVSLQKGPAAAQLEGMAILDPMTGVTDFADTAAIVQQLDLVIGVDTAVVHLAGALGVPVWVLSRFSGCWRWLLDRDDSPWYPSLRLFRQQQPGDWAPVVARVREELLHTVRLPRHDRGQA
ncbi:Tfp pilus assembly protein PilF [Azospirillum lipoferum]|uniref:Glycosyltransferase n=1 Tax=Azospirillum lipoferum TaxID=193 RepID=A0A5A9GQ17_AZOLI|nr:MULTISPECIES: tetratricopeptide repeat-containing glycosyltransferase family protein [Azospirillum]KAA0596453.1 glycosyltransferase [Azospirillum lipoferum]MCP1610442.1 Tfp pilus assembly protein PilF [Azospirillum lipoferum]MDW5538113.1 tetratricopeptide repeat-containing glycosyltransferase family protein [Azospirillum sp. NL1]